MLELEREEFIGVSGLMTCLNILLELRERRVQRSNASSGVGRSTRIVISLRANGELRSGPMAGSCYATIMSIFAPEILADAFTLY